MTLCPVYDHEMYPEQYAAFFNESRTSCIEATTKAGKTHGGMRWLLDQAIAREGIYWWVSPVYAQATMVRRRYMAAIPSATVYTNRNENSLYLPNGSVLWFKSGSNPDHLYGEDVNAAVLDEASRHKEAAVVAVRSTLTSTQGPWRLVGNVRGRGNLFYKLCRQAESGDLPDAEYHKITAATAAQYDIPGLPTEAEIENARATLPPAVFQELFLAEASGSDINPFGIEAIESCVGPLSTEPVAFYGVDLAKSVDYTVVIGLDLQGRVCHYDRWQGPWNHTIPKIASQIGETTAFVDSTGVGAPVVEQLQSMGCSRTQGYLFTAASKQRLLSELQIAIHSRSITYPRECVDELSTFEYRYTPTYVLYSAPPGHHDDIVCALALAWMARTTPTWDVGVLE